MNNGSAKTNLLGMSQDMLEQFFAERGEKPFRARQVMQWIYQRNVLDFDEMTDLSKKLREQLHEDASIVLPRVQTRFDSTDGTVKWLFATDCGQAVETVFIPEPGRGTLCISSQVGCALDCAFCATGAQGFNRNLTAAEIIGQVYVANSELPRRDNGEPAVTRIRVTLDQPGPRRIRLRVPVQDGERVAQNNERDVVVEVREAREKILYLEGEPRFGYGQGVEDFRHRLARKLHVDHSTDDLNDFAATHFNWPLTEFSV